MKFYRHYKNKNYKYLGTVRHSETLEELALYETRYENDLGRVWVRPRDMFFESIEINGQSVPRFKEVPLKILTCTEVGQADVNLIAPVIQKAFGEWDAKWFYATFNNHKKFHLLTAIVDDQVVGFKLGYERTQQEFYSWLGGVLPEYRGIGIASDLMREQHRWCEEQGYKKIQTKTQNRFRDMLMLNLKHGFEVVGTHDSDEGGMKIVLEKKLGRK